MRLGIVRLLLGAALAGAVLGQNQNNPSSSQSATPSGNNSRTGSSSASSTNSASATNSGTTTQGTQTTRAEYVTTITSVVPGQNGASQTYVFTVAIPQPSAGPNNTMSSPTNGTLTNGTISNGTAVNSTAWNDTLSYLPFTPKLDAAYGIGGGLLILTGIPVATLGGKNRWSALAIISGYSVGLFCLIMIMSFGVTPALQPPSPHAPTAAMRGLYLLAVGISFLIGSGLGIFFYTFAKYWVGAAGGFAFGWYILALHKGGVVSSVGPRWAIIGILTVAGLLAALIPKAHEYVLLISSAWVGATAFTLGVDCFTRAGLKEFYIYNLGYGTVFPSLNGGKFPLTQNMQVELGVVAAAALIAGAVQFKIVGMLQKRRKKIHEEEAARAEAQEIDRAAENFKNVDAELAEWEGKYGNDSSSNTLAGTFSLAKNSIPTLRSSPSYGERQVLLDSPPIGSPPPPTESKRLSLLEEMGFQENGSKGGEEVMLVENRAETPATPTTADPELDQKLQLLAEVRRARQSIRSSMDQLRSSTYSSTHSPADSRPLSPETRSRHGSIGSSRVLERGRYDSGASSHILDGHTRHSSGASALEPRSRRDSLGSRIFAPGEPARTEVRQPEPRPTEWDNYVQTRQIVAPVLTQPPVEHYAVVSDSVGRAINKRGERSSSMYVPDATATANEFGANLARALSVGEMPAQPIPEPAPRRPSRAMTTEELAERHREKLSKLQERVTGPIKEEAALAAAREEYERRQRAERDAQRRRERPRAERGDTAGALPTEAPRSSERARRTEEWRRSSAVPPRTTPKSPPRSSSTLPGGSPSGRPKPASRRASRNTFVA